MSTGVLPPLSRVRVAVDCMGGDHGPSVTLPACRTFLAAHPLADLILVGTAVALAPAQGWARCTLVVATEIVAMDDPIEVALRRKRDSSMRVAIAQLKGHGADPAAADVCVCAGNTGALMAVARYVLKTFDGIDRPAIAALLPNARGGFTKVLDLGANVDCDAENLLQFAVMGSALVSALDGMLTQFIKEEFSRTPMSKLAALVALPVLRRFRDRVDHRRYSGGALLGLRGLVFKAHGSSDELAFERALARAYDAAHNRLLDRVHDRIRSALAMPATPLDGTAPQAA